jgi:YhhN family
MRFAGDEDDEAESAGSAVEAGAGAVAGRVGLLNSATVRRFVFGIWMLWAVLLFGGTLLSELGPGELGPDGASKGALNGASRDAITLVSHLGSSVLLVAAGWVWFLGFSRSAAAGTVALFAAGMTLGAIGDFFNAGVLQDLIKLPDPVLGGMAAFALGHVAYIAGCVRVGRERGFGSRGRWLLAIGFWQAVGIVAWFFVVYCGMNAGARLLVWPALPYSLLLAGTAGVASYLALEDRRFLPLATGAVLFLASDMILAFRMFRGDFPLAGHAVWLTYGPGQMLIVYSIGTAARRGRERGTE